MKIVNGRGFANCAQRSVPHEYRDDMHRTTETGRVFGVGSERWQLPVSELFSPQPLVTPAVGQFLAKQG
jgi:hypothetical protein